MATWEGLSRAGRVYNKMEIEARHQAQELGRDMGRVNIGPSRRSLAPGLRGHNRKVLIQMHRLEMFCLAFDRYLLGLESSKFVKEKARLMLAIGLPKLK